MRFSRSNVTLAFGIRSRTRGAIHLGRVEFAHHEPIRPAIHATAELMRNASADRIVCSEAAATLLGSAEDLVSAPR